MTERMNEMTERTRQELVEELRLATLNIDYLTDLLQTTQRSYDNLRYLVQEYRDREGDRAYGGIHQDVFDSMVNLQTRIDSIKEEVRVAGDLVKERQERLREFEDLQMVIDKNRLDQDEQDEAKQSGQRERESIISAEEALKGVKYNIASHEAIIQKMQSRYYKHWLRLRKYIRENDLAHLEPGQEFDTSLAHNLNTGAKYASKIYDELEANRYQLMSLTHEKERLESQIDLLRSSGSSEIQKFEAEEQIELAIDTIEEVKEQVVAMQDTEVIELIVASVRNFVQQLQDNDVLRFLDIHLYKGTYEVLERIGNTEESTKSVISTAFRKHLRETGLKMHIFYELLKENSRLRGTWAFKVPFMENIHLSIDNHAIGKLLEPRTTRTRLSGSIMQAFILKLVDSLGSRLRDQWFFLPSNVYMDREPQENQEILVPLEKSIGRRYTHYVIPILWSARWSLMLIKLPACDTGHSVEVDEYDATSVESRYPNEDRNRLMRFLTRQSDKTCDEMDGFLHSAYPSVVLRRGHRKITEERERDELIGGSGPLTCLFMAILFNDQLGADEKDKLLRQLAKHSIDKLRKLAIFLVVHVMQYEIANVVVFGDYSWDRIAGSVLPLLEDIGVSTIASRDKRLRHLLPTGPVTIERLILWMDTMVIQSEEEELSRGEFEEWLSDPENKVREDILYLTRVDTLPLLADQIVTILYGPNASSNALAKKYYDRSAFLSLMGHHIAVIPPEKGTVTEMEMTEKMKVREQLAHKYNEPTGKIHQ